MEVPFSVWCRSWRLNIKYINPVEPMLIAQYALQETWDYIACSWPMTLVNIQFFDHYAVHCL
jgi:hypothetical protein